MSRTEEGLSVIDQIRAANTYEELEGCFPREMKADLAEADEELDQDIAASAIVFAFAAFWFENHNRIEADQRAVTEPEDKDGKEEITEQDDEGIFVIEVQIGRTQLESLYNKHLRDRINRPHFEVPLGTVINFALAAGIITPVDEDGERYVVANGLYETVERIKINSGL